MPENMIPVLIVGVMLLIFGVMIFNLVSFAMIGWQWQRAWLSGVRVSMMQIGLMRMRRIRVNAVLDALILAKQSGVEISCIDMERAALQGVDLEKVTLAMIEARRQDLPVTFQEIVDAELRGRLAEKLQGSAEVSSADDVA